MSGNRRTRVQHIGKAYLGFPCLVLGLMTIAMPGVSRAQTAADDVAAQIRGQGYQCDWPATARRDARRSRRDSTVWILSCGNAAYRVRLDPDMAARVIKLKGKG